MSNSVYRYDLRVIRQFDSMYVSANTGARVTLEVDFFDASEAEEFKAKILAMMPGGTA